MGDVYVYTARQECRGASANEPGMEANDVIHVSAEFLQKQKMAPDSPNGWLYGTNMRTRQDGYFPAYFLVLNGARRRSNATPEGKPPLAEQPYLNLGLVVSSDSSPGQFGAPRRMGFSSLQQSPIPQQHCFITVFFITPVLCTHCEYPAAR
ncbi:uncharacterized protein LOC123499235 isoform X2 [Portunus trituberculatus]|uniref:uncharacterized protein LOC123499235 isoform X2 n=1 Tax=Portunus trituberculatus TaxID=210409 RepID=UPI001E1CCC23|nr:uncharacterized protein LOC123499235 isoform X2 [Portunus trituberculatus]